MSSQQQDQERPTPSRQPALQPRGLVGSSLTVLVTGLMCNEIKRTNHTLRYQKLKIHSQTSNACDKNSRKLNRLSSMLTRRFENFSHNFIPPAQVASKIVTSTFNSRYGYVRSWKSRRQETAQTMILYRKLVVRS